MKSAKVIVVLLLAVCVAPAHAQEAMPGMPGMAQPARQNPQPAPQQSSGQQMQGRARASRPNHNPQRPDTMPADMQGVANDQGNRQAQDAARSERNSVQQQQAQVSVKPGQGSDATSFQFPVQEVQEPEALELRTGGDLPAPELLVDVVRREPMTLEQFLHLADESNPTLAEAQRNIDRSNEQARQASLPPDPTVGYSGEHIRGGSYHGGEEGAFFSQEFVLGRKLALRRDLYRAEGKSNAYLLEAQRARVHNDVAQRFFDTLAHQQQVVLRDRLLKVALDTETNTHELERVGQADAAEVLSAEVAAEQAKIDFVQAQRMYLASFGQLTAVAGQGALSVHPLQGDLVQPPMFDPEELVTRDVAQSPLVQHAQANVQLGEAKLRDAKRERVPNLNVTAGEWYSGEVLGNTNIKAGWMSFAQAGVQLPLWNRNQGNIAAARAELSRAQGEVDRTKLWTRNETEPLAQQYMAARFTADRYRTEMLPRARRAYQLQVLKYQQMALQYPEVLAAQRMLFTLQMSYVQSLNQQWQAAIALENYALMGGLDQPTALGSDDTTLNLPTMSGGH